MSAKWRMCEVNGVFRRIPAVQLSLIGYRASTPKKLGGGGPPTARSGRPARSRMAPAFPGQSRAGLAEGMAWARLGSAFLQFVPLLYFSRLRLPWLIIAVALSALLEAWWLQRRVWVRRTLRDPVLVGVDAVFCLGLIMAARAAGPGGLNDVLPVAFCFMFVTVGIVGFGLGQSWYGVLVFAVLTVAWAFMTFPPDGLRLASDLLSLGLYYALILFLTHEPGGQVAVPDRDADLARERDLAFHEIHGHLLPIVDAVAAGTAMSGPWMALAAREAARARRLIVGGQTEPKAGFAKLLSDLRDVFAEAGMAVTAVFRIEADPPGEIAEAVTHTVCEALTNVLKHTDSRCEVHLFAESTGRRLEVVVRDRGAGFEPGTVTPGYGLASTYEEVRRLGGAVQVRSAPGGGTRVRILWPLADGEPAR